MKSVGAYEAKTRLAALLDDVRDGERYTITRHGVPVALLIPTSERADPRATIDGLRSLRRGNRLAGVKLRDLIDEGRRR